MTSDDLNLCEGLLSSNYLTFMGSVWNILKLAKRNKLNLSVYSDSDIIDALISENVNLNIEYKDPIYRLLYYLTNIDENPKHREVWFLISENIYNIFHNKNITPHLFKIVCKIVSNFLMDANEEEIIDFIKKDFDFVLNVFSNNRDEVQNLDKEAEINDSGYICQGCLRIFSALCNQYNTIHKYYPDFNCIPIFFEALRFQNKHMRIVTIKYIYFITNWSPNEVIFYLSTKEFVEFLLSLITNDDKKKNCLSFYSTLILLAISKLPDQTIPANLFSLNLFDKDLLSLPYHSRSYYLHFLFNIAQADQIYADNFIQSKSLSSIINKDSEEISEITIDGVKCSKFMKYISCLYAKYPSTRDNILNLLLKFNPLYFFVSFITQHLDPEMILIGAVCIKDIVDKINSNSVLGQSLLEKLKENSEDIMEDLEIFVSDSDYIQNISSTENKEDYTNLPNLLSELRDNLAELLNHANQ